MSKPNTESNLVFSLFENQNLESIAEIGHGLASVQRLKILKALSKRSMNLFELSEYLKMPLSSVSFNVDILSKAKFINVEYRPALKGHMKLCSLSASSVSIEIEKNDKINEQSFSVSLPVGCYSKADVENSYLVGDNGFIFREEDNSIMLFTPERFTGQLFSFKNGSVTYDFPNLSHKIDGTVRLDFSFEFCSEAPYYCNNWPSDITIWVNEVEIATFTSPGDFGGVRGKYTPMFWKTNSTQFGLLKTFSVTNIGCLIDGTFINNSKTIKDLNLKNSNKISLKIGFKKDAVHLGGINIFGRKFGNYNQDIVMVVSKDNSYDK